MTPSAPTATPLMTISPTETLHPLKQLLEVMRDPADDLRSRKIVDVSGKPLGHIHGLLVDDRENKVRFLEVSSGGFLGVGTSKALIPVDAITKVTEHVVTVDQTREHVAGAPVYDPEIIEDPYYKKIYEYYGYTPYWGPGYIYPEFPRYPGR